MNCPRCDAPAATEALQEFGGVCPKCLIEFAGEKDAPAFPNLEIVSTLGEGGMGVVYKAVQKQLGRTVALKVLSPRLSTDPAFVERFTREAKALAQLDHPNIVGIFDSGVHDGVPYLIMEHVEGHSLRKLLAARKMTAAQALQVVPQICDALAYAHARGVVHRDVKPENILIDREGRVKIADFGLAKLAEPDQTRITRTNAVMGTPHYMAPEQIENPSTVDHRADLYSLGVIFYEMLTGELPLGRFKAPSERADVDRRLDPVVLRSLEKEPDDRYQSADDVKEHVTRLDGTPEPRKAQGHWITPLLPAGYLLLGAVGAHLLFRETWITGLLALTACSYALSVLPSVLKRLGRPEKPKAEANPFARAATVIMALSGITLTSAFFLRMPEQKRVFEILMSVGSALMLATVVISLIAVIYSRRHRGAGAAQAWGLFLSSSFVTLILGAGFASGSAQRLPPATSSKSGFHLKDAWPSPRELPEGLAFDRIEENEEVFGNPPPKEATKGNVTTIYVGPGKEILQDLRLVRRGSLLHGEVVVMGYEFKTEFARKRWRKEVGAPLPTAEGREPEGLSFLQIGTGLNASHAAEAAVELLTPLLQRKMQEAAGR